MTDRTSLAAQWQKDADLPHPPTEFTLAYRQAMQGEGPQAYQWKDKPHRLVFDLCRHIETTDQRCAELEAERDKWRDSVLAVVSATRDHLPPDGITAHECISRVLEATDNPVISPMILAFEALENRDD